MDRCQRSRIEKYTHVPIQYNRINGKLETRERFIFSPTYPWVNPSVYVELKQTWGDQKPFSL